MGDNAEVLRESLAADLVKDLFSFSEDTACATHDMLECKRCPGCSSTIKVDNDNAEKSWVPQEADVVEDELCTWSHHPRVVGVPDDILKDAAKRFKGRGVTFTMGCHIEYTPEMIAKLEEEERALQQKREVAATSKTAKVSEKKESKAEGGLENNDESCCDRADKVATEAPDALDSEDEDDKPLLAAPSDPPSKVAASLKAAVLDVDDDDEMPVAVPHPAATPENEQGKRRKLTRLRKHGDAT